MDLRDWLAVAAIAVALLSSVITAVVSVKVTRMNLRHNAQEEARRLESEERRWHVDQLRDAYATFAKSGWEWMIERWAFLQDDQPQAPPEVSEREAELSDRFETAYGAITLLAPHTVWKTADEYRSAITEVMRWIPGHGVPTELDQQVEAVRNLRSGFITAAREALSLPYDQADRTPRDLTALGRNRSIEWACRSTASPESARL